MSLPRPGADDSTTSTVMFLEAGRRRRLVAP
jgi:hypothetical protein